MRFNPAPGWPEPPAGWTPPPGWQPDPSWPPAPQGWQFWVQDEPRATHPITGKPVEPDNAIDLNSWIGRHPVVALGVGAALIVGSIGLFWPDSGRSASASTAAADPYASTVGVEVTDCWQDERGFFHAELAYENRSNDLVTVYPEVGFYDGELQVMDATDSKKLPAGQSAVGEAWYGSDTGYAADLSCRILETEIFGP